MSAVRVYDSDLIDHEDALLALALSGLDGYRGNWIDMIRFKRAARDGEEFPVRQVLNMLIAAQVPGVDRAVIELLGPDKAWSRAATQRLVVEEPWDDDEPEVVPPEVIERRNRIWSLRWPVVIHLDYAYSHAWNGAVHIIDHDKSMMSWDLQSNDWGKRFDLPRVPQLWLKYRCGKSMRSSGQGYGTKLSLIESPNCTDRHVCRKCTEQ